MIRNTEAGQHDFHCLAFLHRLGEAILPLLIFREVRFRPGISSYNRSVALLVMVGIVHTISGCAPQFPAPPDSLSVSSSSLSSAAFISYDGTSLPLRQWLPPGEIEGVIIAVHGFNDYSNFIKDSVPLFNEHKLALYAYDQRGFGSTSTRGRWGGTQALVRDLATFTELVKEWHPRIPVYLLGESMGGAVVIVMMAGEHPPKIDGVILCAPAVWARREMPFYQRWVLSFAARMLPWWRVTGKSLSVTASDNRKMLIELGKDPLVIKETRIDTLYGLANLMDEAYWHAKDFTVHSLILYGEKDEIIPEKAVLNFYRQLPPTARNRQELTTYENGYHMLLRDLQAALVRKDIMAWIEKSN